MKIIRVCTPRGKQQLVGAGIVLIGYILTAWSWHLALYYKFFYVKISMLSPALIVTGLGIILFPGYKEERTARGEDISRLRGIRLITPRWWAIIAAALAAGGANYLLLYSLT